MSTALYVIQLSVMASCILLWMWRFRVARSDGSILPTCEQQVSPLGLLDIGATVFVFFVLQTLMLLPIYLFMGFGPSELQNTADLPADQMLELSGWLMMSQLAATVAATFWFIGRHGKVQWLGSRSSLGRDLLIGLAGSLMLLPPVMLIQALAVQFIPYTHPTLDSLADNFTGRSAAWAWIAAVGIAPVTEEFFFRGVIQSWLQRVFDHDEPKEFWFLGGPVNHELATVPKQEIAAMVHLRFWAPILITSALFASMHLNQGPAPIPLFFLSLGLGYLFRKSGSFVPCLVVHIVLNSISMTLLTLTIVYPELGPPVDAEPLPSMFFVY